MHSILCNNISMLLLGSSFAKFPLLSLRTGSVVGSIVGHLINPHKLKIDALWCQTGSKSKPMLLLPQDIREVSPKGVIIDDDDVLLAPNEAIRLRQIIELRFEIIDKKVVSGRFTLGKVADYALERDGFTIQKLYVEPSIWNKIKNNRLTIDRSQIIEVSHREVKVKSSDIAEKNPVLRAVRQSGLSSAPSFNASRTEE
jgi:hypothetical protein